VGGGLSRRTADGVGPARVGPRYPLPERRELVRDMAEAPTFIWSPLLKAN
jgi:hypothetical protein